MSWVREAIDEIKSKNHEELYPTAYGGSSKSPDVSLAHQRHSSYHSADPGLVPWNKQIFWALSPNDVPPPVKEAVESAVRQQTLESSLTCAIIRFVT